MTVQQMQNRHGVLGTARLARLPNGLIRADWQGSGLTDLYRDDNELVRVPTSDGIHSTSVTVGSLLSV